LLLFDNRIAEAVGTRIPYTRAKVILVETLEVIGFMLIYKLSNVM
jgi:hypothetical protein